MIVASNTDTGKTRHNNEDSCLIIPPWNKYAIKKEISVFAIADGMGGENCGEVASSIAVKGVKNWFESSINKSIDVDVVEEMFVGLNNQIWEYAQKHNEAVGMGTTLTLLIIKNDVAIVGHIGDSRLYRCRKGILEQITNDHSLVSEQVKKGLLTPEQARVHPSRHILSRALGVRQFITPDIFKIDINQDDLFVMFTDGIYGMIDGDKLKEVITKCETVSLPKKLIELANEYGGKDNSTVIAVKLDSFPIKYPKSLSFERIVEYFKHRGMPGLL